MRGLISEDACRRIAQAGGQTFIDAVAHRRGSLLQPSSPPVRRDRPARTRCRTTGNVIGLVAAATRAAQRGGHRHRPPGRRRAPCARSPGWQDSTAAAPATTRLVRTHRCFAKAAARTAAPAYAHLLLARSRPSPPAFFGAGALAKLRTRPMPTSTWMYRRSARSACRSSRSVAANHRRAAGCSGWLQASDASQPAA